MVHSEFEVVLLGLFEEDVLVVIRLVAACLAYHYGLSGILDPGYFVAFVQFPNFDLILERNAII